MDKQSCEELDGGLRFLALIAIIVFVLVMAL